MAITRLEKLVREFEKSIQKYEKTLSARVTIEQYEEILRVARKYGLNERRILSLLIGHYLEFESEE